MLEEAAMRAEVITVGDELLIGQVVDSNSAWIGSELNSFGIKLHQITSVSDAAAHIREALEGAFFRSDCVLMTGGLGPTRDDITKKVLAEYLGVGLIRHQATFDFVKERVERMGIEFNVLNQAQADVPEGCLVLHNARGTAPGLWCEKDGKVLVAMPGVPAEMKYLMQAEVLPRLQRHFALGSVVHKTMLSFGLPESELAQRLAHWEDNLPHGMQLAYLPGPGGIRLRLSAYDGSREVIEQSMENEAASLKLILGKYLVNTCNEPLERTVGALLEAKKSMVAVAESCTGGMVASRFTAHSGSSVHFAGGVVAYANHVKTAILGVPAGLIEQHGAVSREVVEHMALGICRISGADYGIATSGIAGPTGGSEEKPVGTVWIAVAGPGGVRSFVSFFPGERNVVMNRATSTTINALRLVLLEEGHEVLLS